MCLDCLVCALTVLYVPAAHLPREGHGEELREEVLRVPALSFRVECEDRVRDGPASGGKGSKGRNSLDCIWGLGFRV